jgi:hypothetical protein
MTLRTAEDRLPTEKSPTGDPCSLGIWPNERLIFDILTLSLCLCGEQTRNRRGKKKYGRKAGFAGSTIENQPHPQTANRVHAGFCRVGAGFWLVRSWFCRPALRSLVRREGSDQLQPGPPMRRRVSAKNRKKPRHFNKPFKNPPPFQCFQCAPSKSPAIPTFQSAFLTRTGDEKIDENSAENSQRDENR